MEKELAKYNFEGTFTEAEKVSFFEGANKTVAILCNHQRTASKNFDEQRQKIEDQITEQQTLLERLKSALKGEVIKTEEGEEDTRIPSDPEKIQKKIK